MRSVEDDSDSSFSDSEEGDFGVNDKLCASVPPSFDLIEEQKYL